MFETEKFVDFCGLEVFFSKDWQIWLNFERKNERQFPLALSAHKQELLHRSHSRSERHSLKLF